MALYLAGAKPYGIVAKGGDHGARGCLRLSLCLRGEVGKVWRSRLVGVVLFAWGSQRIGQAMVRKKDGSGRFNSECGVAYCCTVLDMVCSGLATF